MRKYRPPTIAEQGGLRVYLTKAGIDYDYYKELRASLGDKKPGPIAKLLSDRAQLSKPITPSRVARWFKVDDQEMEDKQHATA